jgi:transcription elongation factor Elf1
MVWEKGTKVFECAGCGTKWKASTFNVPVREKGAFECKVCNTLVHRWNGSTDYDDWERVQQ